MKSERLQLNIASFAAPGGGEYNFGDLHEMLVKPPLYLRSTDEPKRDFNKKREPEHLLSRGLSQGF